MIAKQPLVVDPDVLHLQVEQSLQEDASEVQGSATIGSGEEEVAEEAEDAEALCCFLDSTDFLYSASTKNYQPTKIFGQLVW